METKFKLYNMKGVDIMTKIEKLEREKKIWKYGPIIATVIHLLMDIILISIVLMKYGNVEKTILAIIAGTTIVIINYLLQLYCSKGAIKICDYKLEDEQRLKSEIKTRFSYLREHYKTEP